MARAEVRLVVIGGCNFRCYYCYNEYLEAKGTFSPISLKQVKELGEVFTKTGISHVHLTGGEPTLRNDLDTIVGILSQSGIPDVALTTNGSHLTEDYILRLYDSGISELHIHMPSFNPDVHKQVVQAYAHPDKIAELSLFAVRQGLRVRFNVPISRVNVDTVHDILDFTYANGIGVGLIKIEPPPNSSDDFQALGYDGIQRLFYDWCLSRGFKTERDSSWRDFGEPYIVNDRMRVQLLNTSRTHNPVIDNRVWIGADGEFFLFSSSLDIEAKSVDTRRLEDLIKQKYQVYQEQR